MIDSNVTVKKLFSAYLEIVYGKNKLVEMPIDQYTELRRAYYAGIGQLIFILKSEIVYMEEEKAVELLASMLEECGQFWSHQNNNYN